MNHAISSRAAIRNTFIGRYWRGEGPLWRIYWIYGACGSLLLGVAIMRAVAADLIGPATIFAALAIGGSYTAWVLVGIWRCAFNVAGEPLGMNRNGWALLARMLTVAWAINVMAGFLFASTMLG